jgi:hypothetical protein
MNEGLNMVFHFRDFIHQNYSEFGKQIDRVRRREMTLLPESPNIYIHSSGYLPFLIQESLVLFACSSQSNDSRDSLAKLANSDDHLLDLINGCVTRLKFLDQKLDSCSIFPAAFEPFFFSIEFSEFYSLEEGVTTVPVMKANFMELSA